MLVQEIDGKGFFLGPAILSGSITTFLALVILPTAPRPNYPTLLSWCRMIITVLLHKTNLGAGERQERVTGALVSLGPAILNGGVTTFLALVILPFSQSHVFITFFKVGVRKFFLFKIKKI